jgi:hypothetical protein
MADFRDHDQRPLMLDIVIAYFLCAWSIASFAAGGMYFSSCLASTSVA